MTEEDNKKVDAAADLASAWMNEQLRFSGLRPEARRAILFHAKHMAMLTYRLGCSLEEDQFDEGMQLWGRMVSGFLTRLIEAVYGKAS